LCEKNSTEKKCRFFITENFMKKWKCACFLSEKLMPEKKYAFSGIVNFSAFSVSCFF